VTPTKSSSHRGVLSVKNRDGQGLKQSLTRMLVRRCAIHQALRGGYVISAAFRTNDLLTSEKPKGVLSTLRGKESKNIPPRVSHRKFLGSYLAAIANAHESQ